MPLKKILCVAEKPSISKAVAGHLSGGQYQTSHTGSTFIKNYKFTYDFGGPWGNCNVVFTCVSGHLTEAQFGEAYNNWYDPAPKALFQAPISVRVCEDKLPIADNIKREARGAHALFIWTDCDREGEHIGGEVRGAALEGKRDILVKRARFSNIERAHVIQAARNPINLDDRLIHAVAARTEMDLRIGYAFTRYWTNSLKNLGGAFAEAGPNGKPRILSYGTCQFPTLGFVVDRYFRVKNFVPEIFWSIKVTHRRDNMDVNFTWARNRLFDRAVVTIIYERCLAARKATVSKIQEKPTKKWKPLPLTTVEFQKMASRFLRINSSEAMSIAESLYNKGFISYPRTETDRFDKGMDLKALCSKQIQDNRWGNFANDLVNNGKFHQPREGRHDDKAHPPIHPIQYVNPSAMNHNESKVYEFITRRFLACCSEDAKGQSTTITITYGSEDFSATGLVVLERNYLDVYPYENWHSSAMLPRFQMGEQFEPTEAMMTEGKTSPPNYLTEADLIALMDANGIGTDATMAEHISKILEREYVITVNRGGGGNHAANDDPPARGGRGNARGGRGGVANNGASNAGAGAGGNQVFIPTTLGMALVDGYDKMEIEISLHKPFLRKEMELRMKEICEGRMTKDAMVRACVRQYKAVFEQSEERLDVLKASCRRYVINGGR